MARRGPGWEILLRRTPDSGHQQPLHLGDSFRFGDSAELDGVGQAGQFRPLAPGFGQSSVGTAHRPDSVEEKVVQVLARRFEVQPTLILYTMAYTDG